MLTVPVGVGAAASNRGECDVPGGLVVAVWIEADETESVVWFEVDVSVEVAEFVRLMADEPGTGASESAGSGERAGERAEAINNWAGWVGGAR